MVKPNCGAGDKGETSIIGRRLGKDELRMEAIGRIDELMAVTGFAENFVSKNSSHVLAREILEQVETDLFCLNSILAEHESKKAFEKERVKFLESEINAIEKKLPKLSKFVVSFKTEAASRLNLCRAVCRTAERRLVSLSKIEKVPENSIEYLNRLSDLLFEMARFEDAAAGKK